MSEDRNRPVDVMPSEIEVTTVKLYRQLFEKRVYVIESDPEGSTRLFWRVNRPIVVECEGS